MYKEKIMNYKFRYRFKNKEPVLKCARLCLDDELIRFDAELRTIIKMEEKFFDLKLTSIPDHRQLQMKEISDPAMIVELPDTTKDWRYKRFLGL